MLRDNDQTDLDQDICHSLPRPPAGGVRLLPPVLWSAATEIQGRRRTAGLQRLQTSTAGLAVPQYNSRLTMGLYFILFGPRKNKDFLLEYTHMRLISLYRLFYSNLDLLIIALFCWNKFLPNLLSSTS